MAVPIQVVLDCEDPAVLARLWADALDYRLQAPVSCQNSHNCSVRIRPAAWMRKCGLVADTRTCERCGAMFVPRREHARFCCVRCRGAWNREHAGDPAAEMSALQRRQPLDETRHHVAPGWLRLASSFTTAVSARPLVARSPKSQFFPRSPSTEAIVEPSS